MSKLTVKFKSPITTPERLKLKNAVTVRLGQSGDNISISTHGNDLKVDVQHLERDTPSERRVTMSGVHCLLLSDLEMLGDDCIGEFEIVHVPEKTSIQVLPITTWIDAQFKCAREFAAITVKTCLTASVDCIVESLPWRDVTGLRYRSIQVVSRAMYAYHNILHDPVLEGNFDEIVPHPLEIVSATELDMLYSIVIQCTARRAETRLFFYESIFHIVDQQAYEVTPECVTKVFDVVFCPLYHLREGDI